jgi:hypothetical protein
MIKLTRRRRPGDLPKDFQSAKLVEKHVGLLGLYFDSAASGKPMAFSSGKWKSAKAPLRKDTAKKCAYCEAATSVVAHGDVEHFRPKSLYWWLTYSFDNYLFACQICNQLYKGDSFPVQGARLGGPALPANAPIGAHLEALAKSICLDATAITDATCTAAWGVEDADLVHPYLNDPEVHFVYEADDVNEEVWLRAASDPRSQRALAASETTLGLNREELRKLRYAEYATIAVLKGVLDEGRVSETIRTSILGEFQRRQRNDFPFAGMHRYFARQWAIPAPT